jgi:hypothetical protein
MRLYQILLLLICFFALSQNVIAAPDPIEVKKQQANAPLILEGKVLDDFLIEDFKGEAKQIRQMLIEVEEIFQQNGSPEVQEKQIIEVRYPYFPSWMDYSGGGSIKVIKGDRLKLWLNKDEHEFTPILGYYGVEVIQANGPRIEHIKEALPHRMARYWNIIWTKYSPFAVLVFILFCLLLIIRAAKR